MLPVIFSAGSTGAGVDVKGSRDCGVAKLTIVQLIFSSALTGAGVVRMVSKESESQR